MSAETLHETLTRKSSVFKQPRLKSETFLQGGTHLSPEVAARWREQFQLPASSVSKNGAKAVVSLASKRSPFIKLLPLQVCLAHFSCSTSSGFLPRKVCRHHHMQLPTYPPTHQLPIATNRPRNYVPHHIRAVHVAHVLQTCAALADYMLLQHTRQLHWQLFLHQLLSAAAGTPAGV
jgi:hypothetical protein